MLLSLDVFQKKYFKELKNLEINLLQSSPEDPQLKTSGCDNVMFVVITQLRSLSGEYEVQYLWNDDWQEKMGEIKFPGKIDESLNLKILHK